MCNSKYTLSLHYSLSNSFFLFSSHSMRQTKRKFLIHGSWHFISRCVFGFVNESKAQNAFCMRLERERERMRLNWKAIETRSSRSRERWMEIVLAVNWSSVFHNNISVDVRLNPGVSAKLDSMRNINSMVLLVAACFFSNEIKALRDWRPEAELSV